MTIPGPMKTSSRINGGRKERKIKTTRRVAKLMTRMIATMIPKQRKVKTTRRVAKLMTRMIATMIPIAEVRVAKREKAEKDRKKA
jgi:hypothetical protein